VGSESFVDQLLNLSLGMLFLQNVPTKYICKVESQFVVEIPQDDGNEHVIYSLCPSRSGGIYLVAYGVPYVLKFDKDGRLLDRIRTPSQCIDILEVKDGSLLGTFTIDRLILKYAYGGWSNFSLCLEYYPMGLAELSNGHIVACGPDKFDHFHVKLKLNSFHYPLLQLFVYLYIQQFYVGQRIYFPFQGFYQFF
jgi:hypothetical protein